MRKNKTISILIFSICMFLSIISSASINVEASDLIYADYYTYAGTQTIPFHYSGVSKSNNAWIGIYKAGTTPGTTAALAWKYVPANSGTMNFTPNDFITSEYSPLKGLPLVRGKYVAYLFKNSGYDYIASYTFWIDSDDPICRFDVISDLHVNNDTTYNANEKLETALKDIKLYNYAQGRSHALIVNGDSVSSANVGYGTLKQKFTSVDGNGEKGILPHVYFNLGNHELMDYTEGSKQNLTSYANKTSIFAKQIGELDGKLKDGASCFKDYGSKPYYKMTIGKNHFFFLASEKFGGVATISTAQIDWVNEQMYKVAKYRPDENMFVFIHESFQGTTAGSKYKYIDVDTMLRNHLNRYPTATVFTSHTHEDITLGNWVYQEKKANTGSGIGMTIINTASVGDIWRSYDDYGSANQRYSQGLHVDVYDNSVVVRARDYTNGKWIKEYKIDLNSKRRSLAACDIG